MKVLVFSDSHGAKADAEIMLQRESDCSYVFFLGDGIDEAEAMRDKYRDKKFILVKGNNDWYSHTNTEAYKYLEGVTFMACHGHLLNVRFALRDLLNSAQAVRANIALYGHTHKANMYNDPVTGVCAINPGALCEGKYCVITVSGGKFDIEFKNIFQ